MFILIKSNPVDRRQFSFSVNCADIPPLNTISLAAACPEQALIRILVNYTPFVIRGYNNLASSFEASPPLHSIFFPLGTFSQRLTELHCSKITSICGN